MGTTLGELEPVLAGRACLGERFMREQSSCKFQLTLGINLGNFLDMNRVTAKIFLGDHAKIWVGYPFREAIDGLAPGPVSVVQMANVDAVMGVNWAGLKQIALPSDRSASYLQAGDVIFTARGARNFAIALGHVERLAVCAPQFFVIRVSNPNALLPIFLAWQINQRPAQEYFKREALGSDVLNIRRDVIDRLPIALPSLKQQRAVAQLAIAATQERIALVRLIDNRNQQMEAIAMDLDRSERHEA